MDTLIVVARDQQALYDYLRWGLSTARGIRVVLDQRLGERREPEPGPTTDAGAEQRRGSRRRQGSMASELRARGFVIVRDDPRGRDGHAGRVAASPAQGRPSPAPSEEILG